ncbi:hypothetical protein [Nakamurella deserti]|uniref:hypothetical protein n=1 Tax=Nakamurella deserti TaxID=2164074 RepID=UPI000DBE4A21|nr:hypothetical protein [Nakamurella deserti]
MVALFVSLKWRLLTSRLRAATPGRRVVTLVALAVALLVAAVAAFGLSLLRELPAYAVTTAAVLLASQLVAWMLTPLIAFGVDETLDPQRFALLPLRRGDLLRGLAVSSLVGWLPAVNTILLVGVAVMVSPSWGVLPVALACMALQLLLLVTLSRAASTALAGLMSTRRGRDLGMIVGFGVFVVYFAASLALGQVSSGAGFGDGVSAAGRVLGWTPPGALARIPTLVHDGDLGLAAVLLLIALAGIALAALWWGRSLRRSMESGTSLTESSSSASGEHDFGPAAGGTARVVAGRDRLLTWRDPMRRLPWLMVLVFIVLWPFLVVRGHGSLFAVAFGALMSGTQVGNQFGVDGSGMWLHLVAIGDRNRARAEMVGHLLVALVPGSVIVVVGVFVQALLRDDLAWVPAALGLCLASLVASAGLASYMSAVKPYAMPQQRTSMFASAAPQHKSRSLAVAATVLFGGLGVALPGVVFAVLTVTVALWWGWVGLVAAPAIAAAVTWRLVQVAATRYFEQGPEIFAEVRTGDRS